MPAHENGRGFIGRVQYLERHADSPRGKSLPHSLSQADLPERKSRALLVGQVNGRRP
jgi:hypothetical protein